MKTIKLGPNWILQGSTIALAILIALISSFFDASLLIFILPVLLFFPVLSLLGMRFLYCYNAGICYSLGIGKRYINAEDIKGVEFKSTTFMTIFKVFLENGKTYSFFNWQIDEQQQSAITALYQPDEQRKEAI
ncbi:hypothetical protein E5N72_01790 [Pseudoalteromonas sp. MEBiC 03607]|jgi:hypothetical protein|uniref:hypothetical protein n=1 Tax=unclassified Pseudoalteromonas TaxID=194690 RepID=UPI000C53B9B3|nr:MULTISPECIES: hypothetical protein [unclassified Pseudoalteromonas]MBD55789.1 hypothetical protein [Pseudoalteromonas sp.]MBU77454.1 hypothetical protein [Pseudoalteromonadaceae bacterium]MCF2902360.1 hypothetical protein [Pseudoalteromonas sp. OFAV1]MCO7250340.1 hypothetical protein [Pseudoalteromonas sp. Ps84H-4]TGV18876.1 hypothetical protein E5N72_01790 [Pseudoalteromonas sp. MEBiC 03607]|tara:strand:- start:1085 stop:1483 length:399 start_codon:yes stop_codon:yes gene_type:complete